MPGQVYHRQKRSPSRIQSTPPQGQRRWLRSGEGQELAQRHSRGDSGSEASEVNQDDLLDVLDVLLHRRRDVFSRFSVFLTFFRRRFLSSTTPLASIQRCHKKGERRKEGRSGKKEGKAEPEKIPREHQIKGNIIHLCTKKNSNCVHNAMSSSLLQLKKKTKKLKSWYSKCKKSRLGFEEPKTDMKASFRYTKKSSCMKRTYLKRLFSPVSHAE